MVGPISATDLTHSVYPYPARLLRHIPRFFLRCEQLVDSDTVVLDPFCGSGTVLVEAQAAGLACCGIDSNPFARLLTRVKTTPLDPKVAIDAGMAILQNSKRIRTGDIPQVVNIDLWYAGATKRALGRLRRSILEAELTEDLHHFMLVCLAYVADRSSLRDPRIPVPVRHRQWQSIRKTQHPGLVWKSFATTVRRVANLVGSLATAGCRKPVLGTDARRTDIWYRQHLNQLSRPNLILTSPPYGAAQKYIRSTSLALGWTGLGSAVTLSQLDKDSIGREHLLQHELADLESPNAKIGCALRSIVDRDPVRAAIYAHYFRGMAQCFKTMSATLDPGGKIVLVAGSNTVAGRALPTHRLLEAIAADCGFHPIVVLRDTIKGRALLTKRASTAKPLSRETIYILTRKVDA